MFRNQLNLPKLPVPDLRTTLAKYLASVRPLVDDGQFKVTQQAVKEFESVGSLGQTLQQRLIDRYNDPNIINWMDELFVNNSYLNIRGPFRACFSYFFAYKDDKVFKTCTQRAAAITTAALEFKNLVINKELEPDYAGEPLCMDMYNHLFNSARIASFPIDTTMEYDPFLNTHIVVIRKNKFYLMDTVHNGVQLSTSELEIQFQNIIDHAGTKNGLAIGCFTTEDRDTWAKHRASLLELDPKNRDGLEKIQSATFALCLDDTSPQTHDEITKSSYHGDGRNRFFDKTIQFIVFENGKASLMTEHTRVDGSCVHRLSEFICNGLSKNLIHHGSHPIRHVAPPQEITFTTNKEIVNAISEAERKFDAYTQAHDMTVLLYPSMGKKFIKKYNVSPDSLVQMILQLAYFKMFGTIRPTFETTMTRKFQNGRSEICRVASTDVVAFVKTMEDDKATYEEKLFALQSAIKTQLNLMTDAKNGNGIDRHLMCLKGLLKPEEQAPLLFRDHAYSYLRTFHVTSSQVTSQYFECYGYAEIIQNGVGGSYMIHSDSLQFCVSSFKTITIDGKEYSDATFKFKSFLKMACDDVYNLLIPEVTDLAKL